MINVFKDAVCRGKKIFLLAVFLMPAVLAFADNAEEKRTILVLTGGYSTVFPQDMSAYDLFKNSGFSIGMRQYIQFSPENPGGFYWYLSGFSFIHQNNNLNILDLHIAGAGWRGNLLGPLVLDIGISAVSGSKINNDFAMDASYLGVSPLIGFGFTLADFCDIGITAEPVFSINPFASDGTQFRNYLTVSFYIAFKSHEKTEKLNWE